MSNSTNSARAANDDTEAFADGGLPVDHGEENCVSFSGLKRSTIYKCMEEGLLVWSKVGKRRVVCKRSLRRLLASGAQLKAAA